MAGIDRDLWARISPLLDELLEADDSERAARLARMRAENSAMADTLASLLAQQAVVETGDFLEGAVLALPPEVTLAGQVVGNYTLDRLLGQGGMGSVWLAHRSDGRFEGLAAIKFLNLALLGRGGVERFRREGSMLGRLTHPNVARLIDAGIYAGGQPYLILEYVDGEPIDRWCDVRALDVRARLLLFTDVLAAVAHAHSNLVLHRDLKPSNVLVTTNGEVKLVDFGIAKLLEAEAQPASALTRQAGHLFTPEYAAPEQIAGEELTTAADVYSLGVVLYKLLAGTRPYKLKRASAAALVEAISNQEPPLASTVALKPSDRRVLRGDLDAILNLALKKRPGERYQTVTELMADIRRYLDGVPVRAQPDRVLYRVGKFVRRHRVGVVTSVAMILVLVGAILVSTVQMIEARRQRDLALYQSRRAEFQAQFAYQIMSEVGADGVPITIRQLIEKGIEVLDTNYDDDPRFVIGMLVNISGRYMDLGDTRGEYETLVKAEGIARRLGDPDLIAQVQCNTVETEVALGRTVEAAERLRDGLANLARVSAPSFDCRIACSTAEARLLWSEGELDAAVEAATRVAELLEWEGESGSLQFQTISSMLAVMQAEAGRIREAMAWNGRLIAELERAGKEGTLSMSNARHNEAVYLFHGGDVRAAYDLQQRAVQRIVAQQGLDGVPPPLAHRFGFYQVRIEETDAGLVWIDRAVAAAAAQNDSAGHVAALLSRAQALLLLGRLEGVLVDVEEAERLSRASLTNYRAARQWASLLRAQWLLARGETVPAQSEIDLLLADTGYPRQRGAVRLVSILTLKARTELALARYPEALEAAREALAIAEATALHPQRSANVGAALMVMAEAQRALGDEQDARASARRAVAELSASLGPDHSETRTAALFEVQGPGHLVKQDRSIR